LLSADLIWSTIDNSTRRILDSGTDNLGAVVGHKYAVHFAFILFYMVLIFLLLLLLGMEQKPAKARS
jgi:hypothetical protein